MSPDQLFIVALLTAVVPLVGLVVTAIVKINSLHRVVNSRLTQLLELTAAASKAEGVVEGRTTERQDAKPQSSSP